MNRVADTLAVNDSVADPGHLRHSVAIAYAADVVRLQFGPWQTTLPRDWIDSQPVVIELLERRATFRDGLADAGAAALTKLLCSQGCFVPDDIPVDLPLTEVRLFFEPIRFEWYHVYYAHPLWDELREGRSTRNVLAAWVIHNYHVSRAAGIVAARLAATQSRWQAFFRQDALEEFWHCDAYYFIDAPSVRISGAELKSYVPLPSSTAFEQMCLRTAEDDPVAHLLVAYLQESSIVFRAQSEAFYDEVELRHDLPGFFDSWRDHIKIDIDHGHAEGLSNLFTTSIRISREALSHAIRRAWMAYFFLLSSLDDIREEVGDTVTLRHPIKTKESRIAAIVSSIISGRSSAHDETMTEGLTGRVADLVLYLRESAFRSLGFSRSHQEVMLAGNLARCLQRVTVRDPKDVRWPWVVAAGNYLVEASTRPREWIACVSYLVARLNAIMPSIMPDEVGRLLSKHSSVLDADLTSNDADDLATILFQFDEILSRAFSSSARMPQSVDAWTRGYVLHE